ncbi:hypothetical protein [Deinococcus sp. Arct2-2]
MKGTQFGVVQGRLSRRRRRGHGLQAWPHSYLLALGLAPLTPASAD